MSTEKLFHFSCEHSEPFIDAEGFVKPMIAWRRLDEVLCRQGEPMTGLWRAPAVVWLTHDAEPDRRAHGLTSHTLSCDRTVFRYTVEGEACPWLDWVARHGANPEWLAILTGDPSRWLVATSPLRVVAKLDRRRKVV